MAEGHRVQVPPVPAGKPRPRWSVMIPTYQCAGYLREALASVLAQDPGPEEMQIEVVDDHSTADDPQAVVRALGGDRVGFYRQSRNVGHVRNFETCLLRSRGQLVHLLHGDDRVRPGFYQTMERAFASHPEIGAAFCRGVYLDPDGRELAESPLEREDAGVLHGWLERIASGQRVATPTVVVRRDVYERLRGFDRRAGRGEDWEMWVRIAAHSPVGFEPAVLAEYRVKRPGSLTGEAHGRTDLVGDMRRVTRIIQEYLADHLPAMKASASLRRARLQYAHWALNDAEELFAGGHWAQAALQSVEALRCSPSRTVARRCRDMFLTGSRGHRTAGGA